MNPSLKGGDRLIVLSYKLYHMLPESTQTHFKRGQVVMIDAASDKQESFFLNAADSVVRFVTAQQVSILNRRDTIFIKRIIALPGDEISMENFIIRIKPANESFYFTEFELSSNSAQIYETILPKVPDLWDASLPFSGNMDPIILAEDEYFVLSDDRSNTNDSRTWGPVDEDAIRGRAVFRFWPFTHLGTL
jgi:signal peptidase I